MNLFSPSEIMHQYLQGSGGKAAMPLHKMIWLGLLSGFIIGFGASVANTATHTVDNVSAARLISGFLFPFGLGMITLLGGELFTGNCMMPVAVLEKKARLGGVLRNWLVVYFANMAGGMSLAAASAFFGQMEYSQGGLAAYTIKIAAAKCSLPFANALVLGILCNVLVCMGVLCSLSAKDTLGKIVGAFTPVLFFVVCGYEHSVANMYYIPAGIFASQVPRYAALAQDMGVSLEALHWRGFVFGNLVPVTLGNILGGLALGILMWACYVREPKT